MPIARIMLQPEELKEMFGSALRPASALAFEAAANVTSMFFSITPLPLRTGARRRPIERRKRAGISHQLSIPSRLPRM
jgi:hypothetical protein